LDLTLILTIVGIALSILIPVVGYFYKSRKELRNYYSLIWKNSKKISPKDLLNERPFEEKYFKREVDDFLRQAISERRNVMLVGPPLSGKTRAFYNFLKDQKRKYLVLAPRSVSMNHFAFPSSFGINSDKIIFIDDFQNYVDKQDTFPLLFKSAKNENIPVVATCHSGKEYSKAINKLIENNLDADVIFGGNIYEIGKVSAEDGRKIAESSGRSWDMIRFNGTIGSIFMKLSEMQRRFEQCSTIEKTILRSIRNLYACGVYTDNTQFRLDWIKKVSARSELTGKDFEWSGWLKSIEEKEFVQMTRRNFVWAEDAYLEYIIKPDTEVSNIEEFEDIIEIFSGDPEVLQMAGERAYDKGSVSMDILKYIKLSIQSFERVIELIDPNNSEQLYFKANKCLGICHWRMSRLENTRENCLKSIEYYKKILGTKYISEHPLELAMVKSKLGNTFTLLAGIENKEENCSLAITNLNEALNVYTIGEFPAEHASVLNGLGTAYMTASNSQTTTENLIHAVRYFEDALKIRTLAEDPKGHAYTKNNLAGAYARISQIENMEKNLNTALMHYEDALKIYDKKKYPFEYGMILNNIGNVYCLLSTVNNKSANATKAKEYFERSLEVRKRDSAPVIYSNTMFNLGDAYSILFEAEGEPEYLHKSNECLIESLKVDLPNFGNVRMGEIYYSLGTNHMRLAKFEYKHINYNKSIEYFEKALIEFLKDDPAKLKDKTIEAIENVRKELSSDSE